MNFGKLVFSQLTSFLNIKAFQRCVKRYNGNHKVRSFSCWDQFLCMVFAQLTYRESLRDIEACLRSAADNLYHMGIRSTVSRSTLADANESRDWRIFADFALIVIDHARALYKNEDFGVELDNTVYALDTTTIDLCLSLFPWAQFRKKKGAIKLHTLLDLKGNIPAYVWITDGKTHEVNILDLLVPDPGSIYIMDRGFTSFERMYTINNAKATFIIRAKSNLRFRRLYSRPVDKSTGLRCDQTIVLTGVHSKHDYPEKLRRIKFFDEKEQKNLNFFTNDFTLPAFTIAQLYKYRWQIEMFFKWIKQHLRIKSFYGTSENAVKTQIWIAITVYVLIAIVKKQLNIQVSLYTFLQILSVRVFAKVDILQLLTNSNYTDELNLVRNQLSLFDL